MPTAKFLCISARPEEGPRAREYAAMLAAAELTPEALVPLEVELTPLPRDLFSTYRGVVVGGSPFSVTDAEETKSPQQRQAESELTWLAREALERDFPAFFTCYGIGILTTVLGGTVDRTHPEEVSAVEQQLTAEGVADPIAGALPARFWALTGHKESAPVTPPGATLLATNPRSPVQLYRAGRHVYASQFHPEPTTDDFVGRAQAYARNGYFPADEVDRIVTALRASQVTEPRKLFARFVELHS